LASHAQGLELTIDRESSRRGIAFLRRNACAQEWREIAARLIDYAATNELRACASLGRLEHFARAVDVGDERIDL
jgi:hypothetical protein